MIKFDGISKQYGSRTAVDNLSFICPEGEITGFLGNNGAGKSTSIGIALGLLRGTGSVSFDGKLITSDSRWSMNEVGFVLSAPSLNPRLSVRTSMKSACKSKGVVSKRGQELLEQFGLGDHLKKRVSDLSLGLLQRLALAHALITRPKYLVLDEPTTGLDVAGSQLVWNILRAEVARGVTLLVSSHQLPDIATVVNRVVVISDGHLVSEGSLSQFVADWADVATMARSPNNQVLLNAALSAGMDGRIENERLVLKGDVAKRLGQLALQENIPLEKLVVESEELQAAFLSAVEANRSANV